MPTYTRSWSTSRETSRNGRVDPICFFPHSKHWNSPSELSLPPHYHLSLIIHQLQRRLPSVLSLSASAMSSSEGVTGSEFVRMCSGSLQGKAERCNKGSHRDVLHLPLPKRWLVKPKTFHSHTPLRGQQRHRNQAELIALAA